MKQTKHLAFAIALTFIAGLFWSTQAQVTAKATKLQSIEISTGTESPERGVVNGISFLGKTTGSYPGSFFMSMDYSGKSQATNIITIGSWSLPVYRANQYQGAIYGRVVDGTMEWNADKTIATVKIALSIEGGTQTFSRSIGQGSFVGTLNRTTRGKPTLNGTLTLEF